MIALWMLYAAVLAALLGGAAACADSVFRAARRATRIAWGVAMLGSLLLPIAGFVIASRPTPASSAPAAATTSSTDDAALAALLARARVSAERAAPAADWRMLDRPLLALWLAGSLAALGWLGLSRRRLRVALRTWQPAVVRDEPVLVTPDVGPAVIGEEGGRIVLPTWALALDDRPLALMLAHERSHLVARDPQLLAAGTLAAALMPWNPALWWQLRRLRLAVEIDCDRRVLRHYPDVPTYGALLLDVARRDAPRHPLPAAALSSATTSLQRRIQTMTMRRPRHLALRALAFGALGTALVVAACEAPHPTGLKPQPRVALTSITNDYQPVSDQLSGPAVTDARVRAAIQEKLPALARGVGRPQMAWFVEDASGKIVNAMFGDAPKSRTLARVERDSVRVDMARGPGSPPPPPIDPAWLASIDAKTIASVDVMKLAAGRVAPDSTSVIWVRLLPAATGTAVRMGDTTRPTAYAGGYLAGAAAAQSRTQVRASGDSALQTPTVSLRRSMRTDTAPAAEWRSSGQARIVAKTVGANGDTIYHASSLPGQPVFIVDGRVLPLGPDGKPAMPDANTIESVEVFKGPMAKQLYGDSSGANGVVKITTKKAPR